MKLHFITSNQNKLSEVQVILGSAVDLENSNLNLVEVQGTIEEVSVAKCRQAAIAINGAVLVEDTCLCFNALNGLPGPYIKWFLQGIGHEGLNNLLAAYHDKSAEAVCTFAYSAGPGRDPILFQGRTVGKIVHARGATHFGWDPIFEYEGRTYAEMDKAEKNKVSHRSKALAKLRVWLESQ